jgi:radical SAM superfamily enzyme YgiQ (UPF0313 family)
MKILLIKPPLNPNLIAPSKGEPLELEYLASAAKEHDVEILDMRIDKNLMKKLDKLKPNLVGVTAYTCDVNAALEVFREVKKYDSRIKTIIGGYHATAMPSDFALPFVDVIFQGMADFSFKQYLQTWEAGGDFESVKNIALVKGNDLLFTEQEPFQANLDSLPFPLRHLTRHYRKYYRDQMRNKIAMILSSRGCPFRCTFCACWKMMYGKYLVRNPESVVEEMSTLPEDVSLVFFADDNTLHSIGRAWRLSELIKKRKINKRFTMYARADTIVKHPDLIESLRDAGLESLTVGVESSRDEQLDKFKKKTSVQINNEAIRILQKLRIGNIAHFIVNPNFTKDDFRYLLEYVLDRRLFQPVFTVLTPLPGTELYQEYYDQLLIKNYDFYDHVHSVLPAALSRKEFYEQVARLYRKSYSFARYFKSRFNDLRRAFKKSKDIIPRDVDRLSFIKLVFLHILGYSLYLKYINIYKTEPLILKKEKTGF